MRKSILLYLLSSMVVLVAVLIGAGLTFGWFAKAVTVPKGEISSGDLTYILDGELISSDMIIVPGQELVVTDFALTNTSSIPSQLRMSITYLAYVRTGLNVVETELYYQGNETDFIIIDLGSNFTRVGNYWYYSEDDLVPGPDYVIPENSGLIHLFSSVIYDGTLTGIDFASQEIYIVFTVEVKQANRVSWSELVNINFQTGKPN